MAGVFLSYSRADGALAEQVITGLRRIGVQVWWDQDMPGVDWQEELAREIESMVAVVVLWTPNSVASKNVKDEARLGQNKEKIVNVLLGVRSPPFPFDRVNGLPLDGWNGRDPHNGWSRLVQTIEALAVAAGAAQPGDLMKSLGERERTLRQRRQAIDQAQEGFQDAQTLEAEAAEAAKEAQAALALAEAQLRRVGEIGATPAILRAAQQEFDAAYGAKGETDRAHRAARAQLSAASRQLTKAKAQLEASFQPLGAQPQAEDEPDDPVQEGAVAEAEPAPPPPAPATPAASPELAHPTPAPASVFRWTPASIAVAAAGAVALVIIAVVLAGKPRTAPPEAAANAAVATANAAPAAANTEIATDGSNVPTADIGPLIAAHAAAPGVAAYSAHNYAQAMQLLQPLSDAGNAVAQEHVAYMYEQGLGVTKDVPLAWSLYQKSAAQNNPDAQDDIGRLYWFGIGVAQDYKQAMTWYQAAAAQGDAMAQYSIGLMYLDGLGVDKDAATARGWFTKAAANGSNVAQAMLDQNPPGAPSP